MGRRSRSIGGGLQFKAAEGETRWAPALAEFASQLSGFHGGLEGMEEELATLENQIRSVDSTEAAVRRSRDELATELATAEANLAELADEIASHGGDNGGLAELETLEARLEAQTERATDIKMDTQTMKATLEAEADTIAALEVKVGEREAAILEAQEEEAELASEAQQTAEEATAADLDRIETIAADGKRKRHENDGLATDLDELMAQNKRDAELLTLIKRHIEKLDGRNVTKLTTSTSTTTFSSGRKKNTRGVRFAETIDDNGAGGEKRSRY